MHPCPLGYAAVSKPKKIRTPYRPTFFQLACESGVNKQIWGPFPNVEPPLLLELLRLHRRDELVICTADDSGVKYRGSGFALLNVISYLLQQLAG